MALSAGVSTRPAALLLGIGLLAACDTTAPSDGRYPYQLEIVTGDAQTGEVGALLPAMVHVTVRGRALSNVAVEWSADAGGSVAATTRTDAQGLTIARWTLGPRPGPQHLTAGLGTGVAEPVVFAATAVVGGLGRLTVQPEAATLPTVRDSVQLSVVAADRFGNPLPIPPLAWTSLDPQTARVGAGGVVHGVSAGSARIVVASGGVQDTARVLVIQTPADVITLPDTLRFGTLGRSVPIGAAVRDAFGNLIPSASVAWRSLDAAIARVDAGGRVTAVANGTTAVVAQAGIAADTTRVIVAQVPLYLAITPLFPAIFVDDSVHIVVTAFDSLRSSIPAPALAWESSDSTIAAVIAGGWVRGLAVGHATLKVVASPGDAWGQSVVTVSARP